MSMSEEAARGLRAAVRWNPDGAGQLLGMLRALPISVRRKPQDRYGPLAMMLTATPPTTAVTATVRLPVQRIPLPDADLRACEVFTAEWLAGQCTRRELAEAIAQELAALALEAPQNINISADTLIFRQGKVTLHGPDGEHMVDTSM